MELILGALLLLSLIANLSLMLLLMPLRWPSLAQPQTLEPPEETHPVTLEEVRARRILRSTTDDRPRGSP